MVATRAKSLSPTIAIILVLVTAGTAIELVVPRTIARYLQ